MIVINLLNLYNQHNAAKALCPATVQLLKKAFVNCHDEPQVVTTILQCKIVMVHTLLDTRPDQVSIIGKRNLQGYQSYLSICLFPKLVSN